MGLGATSKRFQLSILMPEPICTSHNVLFFCLVQAQCPPATYTSEPQLHVRDFWLSNHFRAC